MSLTVADYARVQSAEGHEFVLEARLLPKKFPSSLPYSSRIVETIIMYLHYRNAQQRTPLSKLPEFEIPPELALDLLKAATDLGI